MRDSETTAFTHTDYIHNDILRYHVLHASLLLGILCRRFGVSIEATYTCPLENMYHLVDRNVYSTLIMRIMISAVHHHQSTIKTRLLVLLLSPSGDHIRPGKH